VVATVDRATVIGDEPTEEVKQVNKKKKRRINECSHAMVRNERFVAIRLSLIAASLDGSLDIQHLAEGKPLAPRICHHASLRPDGHNLRRGRGWLKLRR
jgi:hypothetical protein